MKEKVDLRIIKTNKVLYEALLDLLKEQTFEEIKVSDICAKALVNSVLGDEYKVLETYKGKELERMEEDGTFEVLPKKEVVLLRKEMDKLNKLRLIYITIILHNI